MFESATSSPGELDLFSFAFFSTFFPISFVFVGEFFSNTKMIRHTRSYMRTFDKLNCTNRHKSVFPMQEPVWGVSSLVLSSKFGRDACR